VWGKILRTEDSLARRALPIGLAHKLKIVRPVSEGAVLSWDDVAIVDDETARFRKEMEAAFGAKKKTAA
jgi:predicted homoserine dehydrogenase-like protein